MEIKIRGLELWEALEEISYHLEECQTKRIQEISIIHGYRNLKFNKNNRVINNKISRSNPYIQINDK